LLTTHESVDGLVDEKRSWDYFEKYLASNTISEATFTKGHDALP
jgi:hypothetical protein